jgi:hypothetical protein
MKPSRPQFFLRHRASLGGCGEEDVSMSLPRCKERSGWKAGGTARAGRDCTAVAQGRGTTPRGWRAMTSSLRSTQRDGVSHGQAPPSRPAARTLAYGARAGAQPRPYAGADARTLIPRCPPSRFRLSYTELLLWVCATPLPGHIPRRSRDSCAGGSVSTTFRSANGTGGRITRRYSWGTPSCTSTFLLARFHKPYDRVRGRRLAWGRRTRK